MTFPVFAIALASLLATPALAATPKPPRPPQLGLCAACHGTHGHAVVRGVPNLAGQRYGYLVHALKQYKSGKRDVAVMRAAVGPLTMTQLKQLARWFADQSPCPPQAAHTGEHP